MREFVEAQGVGSFQHVDDQTAELWLRFGVTRQRTYVYINDDGTQEVTGYGSLPSDVADLQAR